VSKGGYCTRLLVGGISENPCYDSGRGGEVKGRVELPNSENGRKGPKRDRLGRK